MTDAIDTTLARCPLFARLDPDLRTRVRSFSHLRRVAARTPLFRQGDPCTALFLVVAGLARVFQLAPSGKEHTLHLATPGQTFAEIAAMDGGAYPASAATVRPCELLVIEAERMRSLLAESHVACHQLVLGMAVWMRRTIALMEDVVLRDAQGRLANWLLRHQDATGVCEVPGNQAQLASHLDMTPETLSRSLRHLAEAGLVVSQGRSWRLVDSPALELVRDGL